MTPMTGCAVLDERDVDRELTGPLDELLRPVQGVDEPEPAPLRGDAPRSSTARIPPRDREWSDRSAAARHG